jgi:hypothetical protein
MVSAGPQSEIALFIGCVRNLSLAIAAPADAGPTMVAVGFLFPCFFPCI